MVRPILETMYPCRQYMVPCFLGAPGISKTAQLYQFAKDINKKVVTFILSNTVPSEVSGIRMPDKETKKMEVFDDARMASLEDGDILFFDEILEAPPMLWSACLTLIQDRIMASGKKLPDVFIVAASNEVATPGIIPASTRDRFQFIKLTFDFYAWQQWMNGLGFKVPAEMAGYIRSESEQYNILTPRRVTKLSMWLREEGDRDVKLDVISDMFDGKVASLIARIADSQPTLQEQVKAVVCEIDPDIQLPDDFERMKVADILAYLQALEQWPAIMKELGNTMYAEAEDESVIKY